jgi:hypothetical protein
VEGLRGVNETGLIHTSNLSMNSLMAPLSPVRYFGAVMVSIGVKDNLWISQQRDEQNDAQC